VLLCWSARAELLLAALGLFELFEFCWLLCGPQLAEIIATARETENNAALPLIKKELII
jgi:hypothetical protein